MSLITEIKNANIIKLMERFDLHKFPKEQLERLKMGKPYKVEDVFNRLQELGVIKFNDMEFFKTMLDMESGYRIDGDYLYRTKTTLMEELQNAVSGYPVIDPDID